MPHIRSSATLAVKPAIGAKCGNCSGRLYVLIHVAPVVDNPPVTYYSCDRCAQVLIVEDRPNRFIRAA